MKTFILTLIAVFINQVSFGQQTERNQLPKEIEEFYFETNIINSFSSNEERSLLVSLINKNEPLPKLTNNRIRYIYQLLIKIQSKVDHGNTMPNSMPQNSWKFQSYGVQQIVNWTYHENSIQLKIKKLSLPLEVNTKLISQFDDYKQHNFTPLMENLSHQLPIMSTSVQTWHLVDGKWVKEDLEMVFVE